MMKRDWNKKCAMVSAIACALTLGSATTAQATSQNATAIDAYTLNEYWESQLHEYGTAVTWNVANGATYSNLSSTVTAVSGASTQSGTHVTRDISGTWTPPLVQSPPQFLGSTATLLAGTNNSGSATAVSMAWRTRTDIEVDTRGYPTTSDDLQMPPAAYDSYGMISDIVDLTGSPGTYVLEMEYDESVIIITVGGPYATEQGHAELGFIYLGWFEDAANAGGGNVPTREWVNAVDGNTGVGVSAVTNYQGSYADYLADLAHPDAGDLTKTLGSWGVDTTDNTVWAVLNHNSEFGAVPEPGSIAWFALAGLTLARRPSRRKA